MALTQVTASFGTGATPVITLSGGTANLTLGASGVVGDISGTVAVNLPSVEVSGDFDLHLDTTGTPKIIRFAGSNIVIVVAGQTLTVASVELTQTTDSTGAKTTTVALDDAVLELAGFGEVEVDGDPGRLPARGGRPADHHDRPRPSAMSGSPPTSLRISINSGAQAVVVGGVTLPAGPYLRIDGIGMSLSVGPVAARSPPSRAASSSSRRPAPPAPPAP